jgi:hypothetical protein
MKARLRCNLVNFAFGGRLASGDRLCLGAFGSNLAAVTMNIFSRLISFNK